ncbi:DNA mismatch repair endonuclease MutL [Caldilinea sp.]|uniref:DNA mismatch repair endonuclease MutL n=1 Tax=Caldilinea sp. TaxID=2293560 RepID=UPI002D1B9A1B|nr:DNA mismatch repair endonuclease MutL [Caldilinea sp.]HRA66295.1 DNA mismatch repair endonuclease MutL [Caldilinea sp.]
MSIKVLAPEVASKIAAGEVVERPANAVKELVENSLDAGATEIRVEVREGGRRLLRVIDNGHGIPEQEIPLAFERHATSKLSTAEDLNHIATFGFRGEALFSIGAVSQVTLTSRHVSQAYGASVRIDGGVVYPMTRAGAPVGTTVSVEHLFFNVPARQKFLRAAATESGQIAAIVQHYALAYPERRFSFINESRLVFQSTGSGDLRDVLIMIYGRENAQQMVSLTGAARDNPAGLDNLALDVDFRGDALARGPVKDEHQAVSVTGYASLPSLTRANRSAIDLFVNRRYVEDRSLTHAVVQAYHTLLPVGRYPVAVVFVEIDPSQVDVNVHPQKTQVRFVEERRIFAAVQKAVRRTIISVAPIPDLGVDEAGRLVRPEGETGVLPPGWAARHAAILDAGAQPHFDLIAPPPRSTHLLPGIVQDAMQEETPSDAAKPTVPASSRQPSQLAGATPKLPPLRVVGQVGAMYVVAEGPQGLFLIDQHAAHERILYEQFMLQRAGGPSTVARQHLLDPLTLHVGAMLTGQVAAHLEALQHVGFDIEPFGGDAFLVRAVPALLAGEDPQRVLEEIVATLGERRNLVGEGMEAQLVKMVCKRAAIKAGQLLSDLEMQELVRQLEECQSPRTCPHGRPTMIQLSANELEKAFGRI